MPFEIIGADELQAMAPHVDYEDWMLVAMADQWRVVGPDELEAEKSTAYGAFESLLLHARTLAEFLWPKKDPHSDGIYAGQYLATWAPHAIRGLNQHWAPRAPLRQQLHTRAAHINRIRATGNLRWYRDDFRPLHEAFLRFIDMLPDDRAGWFGKRAWPPPSWTTERERIDSHYMTSTSPPIISSMRIGAPPFVDPS